LPEPRLVGADSAALGSRPLHERQADVERFSGADDSLEYFRTLQRALAEHPPLPYAGDLDIIVPSDSDEWPSGGASVKFWAELCLGDVRFERVPHAHAACLRGEATEAVVGLLRDRRL
jgi:hypothetical protein